MSLELRINRVGLLNELLLLNAVARRNTTTAVLSHVALRTDGTQLGLEATDLEMTLTSVCDAEVNEPGEVTIDANRFLGIVKACGEESLELSGNDKHILKIKSGRSTFNIKGMGIKAFPSCPEVLSARASTLPSEMFNAMIASVMFSISSANRCAAAEGALLSSSDGFIKAISSDGHRASVTSIQNDGIQADLEMIIGVNALRQLSLIDSPLPVEITRNDSHAAFKVGSRTLTCRLIEGEFVDVEPVFKVDGMSVYLLNRKDLMQTISRVKLMTSERSISIQLRIDGSEFHFSSENPDTGEAFDSLECEGDIIPEVLFNPSYLLEALAACDTEMVSLELKDSKTGVIIKPVNGRFWDQRYMVAFIHQLKR